MILRTGTQIKYWFDAGNYAIESVIEPISVIIDGDTGYIRARQIETFTDTKEVSSRFEFYAMNIMKNYQGRWMIYASSFADLPPK